MQIFRSKVAKMNKLWFFKVWFLFLYLYKTFTYLWCEFHKIWLLFACSFVVVASCLLVVWVLSLGVDDPIECESNPQQSLEHNQQQGKLFDHINPTFFKSLLYLQLVCMHGYFVVKVWLVDPIDAWFLGKCSPSTTIPRTILLWFRVRWMDPCHLVVDDWIMLSHA